MDKFIVLGLALCALVVISDANRFGGHHHRRREAMGKMFHHHRSHMKIWLKKLTDHMMRMNPLEGKIALMEAQCALKPSSFPKMGTEQHMNLWPTLFANVKSKEACEMLCYGEPWGCGAYVVADGMGGPTPCILFTRSRASEMGASSNLPEEMKNNGSYYEMQCNGKFMSNKMIFKIGKRLLMRRMPMMLAKIDPLLKSIKERLGLAEPEKTDTGTNPFAKSRTGPPESHRYPEPPRPSPESRRYPGPPRPSPDPYHPGHSHHRHHDRHHPSPDGFGPPPPRGMSLNGNAGKATVGHPEQMKDDVPVKAEGGSNPNDHPTFNRKLEPGEIVQQGHIDAPKKPKVGPNGEPAGWTPGQAEVGQGWKRRRDVDPEIAAEQAEKRRHRRRRQHHKKRHDPDAF